MYDSRKNIELDMDLYEGEQMGLKESMPMILKEYADIEKQVSSRGQKKYRVTKDDVDGRRISRLPFKDGEVKTALALGPLSFVEQFQEGVEELNRILGKNGKIGIAVWTKTGKDFVDGVYYHPLGVVVKVFGRYFKAKRIYTIYLDDERALVGLIGKKK
jgi:ubiquinone/menaquinone biosynthesis C-methylase UbiE